jgi:hypothetical protein
MLVGQSLDLAAINIARGRGVGLPTLNQTRADLFSQTSLTTLTPYASWSDFGDNLLHPASQVNFIAAYARGGGFYATRWSRFVSRPAPWRPCCRLRARRRATRPRRRQCWRSFAPSPRRP